MRASQIKANIREASFVFPAALFMIVLFAVPLLGIAIVSVQQNNDFGTITLASYYKIFVTPLFFQVAYTTFEISLGAAVCSLALAYPVAYFLSKQSPRKRALYMIFVLVPFWTSALVKSFSLMILLGKSGIVNQLLGTIGIGPIPMLYNRAGVMIAMTQILVPIMVFPILTSLDKQPPELAKAAAIMGAGKLRIFLRVTLPLSLPGVMAGALLSFIISLGFYIVPALLGSRRDIMLANLVDFYAREVLDWPMASAIAVLLIVLAMIATLLLSKVRGGASILSDESH